jgi:hypothetical protein
VGNPQVHFGGVGLRRDMKRALVVGVRSLIVAGCGSSPSSSSSSTPTSPTAAAAQKLATFQPGAEGAFESALNDLKPVCRENPDKLAAEIWASWQDLKKNNRPTSLLHVAQALDTVGSGLTPNAEPTNCASLLAAYLVTAEAPGGQP